MLELAHVDAYYGPIQALTQLSITVRKGEIVSLIGSNGAGKTTTLRSICGQVRVNGSIRFLGEDITGKPPHIIAKTRISHVPEGRCIFPQLSVRENLEVGALYHNCKPFVIQERMEMVFAYFPRLKERLQQKGGTMSGGEQQMLAIGRGLMSDPSILLLDEPSMGLAPVVIEQIFEIIEELNQKGMTVLLVEQNAYQALQIAHRGYVIQTGEITLEGPAKALLNNSQVREAYLS
ncbi:ABC transporter ATP-binding protein [Pasteuria penetrans]|uniref:ABC transporter ATP-binding protein n=1 Tax=Pasteuria penetrans TaxID=86005 RepID=UPI000FBBF886|nr:ABC transporter ATP-binding protein [Pasteuria penetrans]